MPGVIIVVLKIASDVLACLATAYHADKPLPACLSFVERTCCQIPREDLALVWELPAAGKPVKKALSPSRAMAHLDRMLVYHDLTYVDAFIMEIPWIEGGEVRHVHAQQ